MKIIWLDTIDSTNSEALRTLSSLEGGTVLAAFEQTAGRGQRGNRWFVQPGKNLTFSVVLKFEEGQFPAAWSFRLNMLCPLVIARFLRSAGVSAKVKWPNDVYVGRRKICGILVENVLGSDGVSAAVLGIGLNVNQTDFPEVSGATSVRLLTGRDLDLNESLEDISGLFDELLPAVFDDDRWASLFAEYESGLFALGIQAQYVDVASGDEFTGVIRGVTEEGRLRMAVGDEIRLYAFKEVSFIL